MPLVMSGVVGLLLEIRTPREGESDKWMSRMAQSVLVPPTSTPIRNMRADRLRWYKLLLCKGESTVVKMSTNVVFIDLDRI